MNATKETTIHIAPPNIQMGEVWIKGTAPLVMHKFSHKAKMQIKAKQEAGSTATKNRKKDAKNFEECYDAIAVLLRVVDVIEGRQALGKPQEGEKK